jgi:hypothetical protein
VAFNDAVRGPGTLLTQLHRSLPTSFHGPARSREARPSDDSPPPGARGVTGQGWARREGGGWSDWVVDPPGLLTPQDRGHGVSGFSLSESGFAPS